MNIDTRYDLLQGAQKQQQAQKNQTAQAVSKTQAIENKQAKTETIDAVKAPRYDSVKIDKQGYNALAKQQAVKAQPQPQAQAVSPSVAAQQAAVQAPKAQQSSQTDQMLNGAASTASGTASQSSSSRLEMVTSKLQSGQGITAEKPDTTKDNASASYASAVQSGQISPRAAAPKETVSPQKIQGQQTRAMSMSMPTE